MADGNSDPVRPKMSWAKRAQIIGAVIFLTSGFLSALSSIVEFTFGMQLPGILHTLGFRSLLSDVKTLNWSSATASNPPTPSKPSAALNHSFDNLDLAWKRIQADPDNPVSQQALHSALRDLGKDDESGASAEQKEILRQSRMFDLGVSQGTAAGWHAILTSEPGQPLRQLAQEQYDTLSAERKRAGTRTGETKYSTQGDESPIIDRNEHSTIIIGGHK